MRKNVIILNEDEVFKFKGVELSNGWVWFTGEGGRVPVPGDRARVYGSDGTKVADFNIPEVNDITRPGGRSVTIRLPIRVKFTGVPRVG